LLKYFCPFARAPKPSADVNTINQKGETPLHLAVFYDHMGIVDFLLNQNAYVNPKDRYYHTPLHHASAECHLNIVNHLIDLRDM